MVDYFRCGYCGHVWTLPKEPSNGARPAVTSAAPPAG